MALYLILPGCLTLTACNLPPRQAAAARSHRWQQPDTGSLLAGNDAGQQRLTKTGDPSFNQYTYGEAGANIGPSGLKR